MRRLGRVEPHLHGVEVQRSVPRDHDLAVERRPRRQQIAERAQLGEVAKQRPFASRPQSELGAGVLEDAAEAVPLRLVLPALADRQLANELRLHRRERNQTVQVGGRRGHRSSCIEPHRRHLLAPVGEVDNRPGNVLVSRRANRGLSVERAPAGGRLESPRPRTSPRRKRPPGSARTLRSRRRRRCGAASPSVASCCC